jgi:hypothetical protein
MNNEYFQFLFNIVGNYHRYELLLRQLFATEFYPLIPNDDNRCVDGLQTRDLFYMEKGQHALSLLAEAPCNVFEMLIGVAMRLEFELAQSKFEKPFSEWFWVLIDNLGLTWATNIEIQSYKAGSDRVKQIVSRLLDRQYESDGEGGLFPLKYSENDQRTVEIWYQMSEWVLENYPIT